MTQPDFPDKAPLTLAQRDFWEEFRQHPGEAVSTVAHAIEITGDVDGAALRRAISQVISETDVLALRFDGTDPDAPWQYLADAPQLHDMDLSKADDPRAEAFARMRRDLSTPIDLGRDPLSAQWLLRCGPERWIWYNRGHHIVLDGYSMGLMEGRCATLYAHFSQGAEAGTPFRRFSDYLTEETAYRDGPHCARASDYWTGRLSAARPLPVIRKGDENYAQDPHRFDFTIADSATRLARADAQSGLGWADLITTLCGIYLTLRLPEATPAPDGSKSLPVWLPYMSRMGSVSLTIPALVVNILPLYLRLHPDMPLSDAMHAIRSDLRQMRRHGRYRIEQIGHDAGLTTTQRFFFGPLINVMPFDEPRFVNSTAQRHVLSSGPGDGVNITVRADHDGGAMTVCLEADPALTPQTEFDQHCRDFPKFIGRALDTDPRHNTIGALTD